MGLFSIPMTKGLPYEIFMRHLIFEMTEKGQLSQILKKWENPKLDCGAIHKRGNPLSWQKLITLFIIVIIGISFAFATLCIEKMYHKFIFVNSPAYCLTVKKANKIRLQNIFNKMKSNLKNCSTIEQLTIGQLYQEMENYNSLLNEQ